MIIDEIVADLKSRGISVDNTKGLFENKYKKSYDTKNHNRLKKRTKNIYYKNITKL